MPDILFAQYFFLAVVVLGMNLIPAFMPPTWLVLAFIHFQYNMPILPLVVIGALMATSGRFILATMARVYGTRFLSKDLQENYTSLGRFLQGKSKLLGPLIIFVYAFFPIPSNQVFIGFGLMKLDLGLISLSFLIGRLISYSIWINITHFAHTSIVTIFSKHLSDPKNYFVEIVGFFILYLLGNVYWKKIMKNVGNSGVKKK